MPSTLAKLGATAVAVAVVGVVGLSLVWGPGFGPADARSPFLGTWISTSDDDGGTQTMTVERSAADTVTIVVTDPIASVCDSTPSTMTGNGSVEGNHLVIPAPDYRCDDGSEPQLTSGEITPVNEFLRNLTYVRDPERNILTVAGTDVWHRPGSAMLTPEPTSEPAAETSPTPRPSPRPGQTTFTSTIHGIWIDYPSGWETRPATEPWTGGELNFDSPAADVIFDPRFDDRLYLVLASQPYGRAVAPPGGPAGDGADAWRNGVLAWICPSAPPFGEFWSWKVDGFRSEQFGCNSGSLIQTDSRGYLIRLVASSDEPGLAETYDWDWLVPVLATVDLRPEEAVDAPSPSESP
jgi:hypothetical protein